MNKNFEINGNKEILFVIETIAREKDIPVESVIEAMEEGLKLAARRKYGHDLLIECKLDKKTGKIYIYNKMEIVDNKKENEIDFDSKKQITLTKAKADVKKGKVEIDGEVKVGNFVRLELPNIDLNRVAVQIARNEIIKKNNIALLLLNLHFL